MNNDNNNNKTNFDDVEPRLRFDAFTGGIQNGGLRSVLSINMLVCYIIANINGRVTAQTIKEAMAEGMIANHFEISEAIVRLTKSGVIKEDEDGALILCKGQNEVDLIEKDLPLSIRDKSIRLCQKIIAREKYLRDNLVQIEQVENGYLVKVNISDDKTEFFDLSLFAPTIEQAELIKVKFVTDPVKIYDTLIDAIFDNEY